MSATAESAFPHLLHQPSPELAEAAIFFPEGLVGCPGWQRFVQVVDSDEDLPVAILQSLDDVAVQLLVTDPTLIEPGYTVPLSSGQRADLELATDTEPVVYCTLTVTAEGSISANLLGPLVVNPVTRVGLQLVLAESRYSTQYPVATISTSEAEAD